ncbi:MAG TPA: peroxiredoxin family protein [Tepidisphaeraceae bacterium]|nr:peroxiredoxin family protein [Tepidisphaeraceae bacterium]
MPSRHRFLTPLTALLLCVALARAALAVDEKSPQPFDENATASPAPAATTTGPLPGHSYHGEAFDEGPRRAAYLMGNTGKVKFPVTTKVPLAQQFFEQGVGQLHGFWYLEAERSFRQVAALDPNCAMAYWGMAMANVNNEKRAKAFLAEAQKRKDKAGLTKYETMWVDALATYYPRGNGDEKERRRQYVRKLEAIVQEFPEEIEPKAFLAYQVWNNDGKLPLTSHQAVDALLDQVFAAEPMHPAHHYRIHLWDAEKAERALKSAARCGQSSPAIAHMWHMPGHTYAKLHRYADSAWQQEASSRVDHAHMARDRVMPYQIHNYAHNQEWLARNLLFVGRARDAAALARNLVELPRHPRHNVVTNGGSAAGMGRDRLIEALSLYDLWEDYVAACDTVLDADGTPESKVKRLRYLGVAHFARGDKDKGAAVLSELEAMQASAKQEQEDAADKAADEASRRNEPEEKVDAAAGRARRSVRNRRRELDRAIAHVRGQRALFQGDVKAAVAELGKADLRKDKMAPVHLAAGDKDKAVRLAKEAVDENKNQVYPLAVYVDVLHRAGKVDEAKKAFEQLRPLSSQADLSLPVFARLSSVASEFGHSGDWRPPYKHADDTGERPSLDALGPFRWSPSPAPDFSLPAADGRTVSLADHRGKPLVVLFYLGYGCAHCTEQLNKFAPEAKAFADAGISLLAVSTDSVPDLSKSLNASKTPGEFPFPLASNHDLNVFKAYHAYDDFEKMPLHGAFLIDGNGLVRWQDISAEPLTDTMFLLAEAKRLLAQPHDLQASVR